MRDTHEEAVERFLNDLGTIEDVDAPLVASLWHAAEKLDADGYAPTLATEYRRLVNQLATKYTTPQESKSPLAAFLEGVKPGAG